MNFQKFANSQYGVKTGMWLGEHLSPQKAERLSRFIAETLANRPHWAITRAVRLNQWVVSGQKLEGEALRRAVVSVFTHAGRCVSDLYRSLNHPERIEEIVMLDDFMSRWAHISQQKRGIFVVAPHISNFDLALLGAAYHNVKTIALVYGKPTSGYDVQNEIRQRAGIRILYANRENEDQVIEALKQGEMVATGIDRPLRKKTRSLHFFGHPAPLPLGHIRMALAADAEIMVVTTYFDPEKEKYGVEITEPFELIRTGDYETDLIVNGERVLNIIESFIRRRPQQWLMYYPVWTQFLDQVDAL